MLTAIKVVPEVTMTISELWGFLPPWSWPGHNAVFEVSVQGDFIEGSYKQLEVLFLGPFQQEKLGKLSDFVTIC